MESGKRTGIHFGLTSGVITTLGLMVGLHAGTNSTLAVVGGILTIAIADSMSDALGIHISKEAEKNTSKREVWSATFFTLLTKMVMSVSFIIPVFLFELQTAIVASVVWGFTILAVLSYKLARAQQNKPLHVIAEHLTIATAVIIATHYVGDMVAYYFT